MTYTDPQGKTRGIGETGQLLLAYLCDHANKNGTFFMTAESMREDIGASTTREIRKLLAGFEQTGVVTRTGELISYLGRGKPTPEYALTWVPGLWKQDTNTPTGVSTGVSGDTRKTAEKQTEPLSEKGSSETNTHRHETEPEPQPDPERKSENGSRSEAGTGVQGGREWTDKHEKLLQECLIYEPKDKDKGKLVEYLRREYEPIVIQALKETPDPDLLSWCIETRRNKWKPKQGYLANSPRELAPWEKAQPDCPECDGAGMIISHNENGTTTNTLCPCTKEPHLRAV